MTYCKTINIRHQITNLNISLLVWQLSLPNPLQPDVKLRMKIQLEQCRQAMLQLHLSDQQVYCLLSCTYIGDLSVVPDVCTEDARSIWSFCSQEKVEFLRAECEEMKRREKTYMETCQRDSDVKVQVGSSSVVETSSWLLSGGDIKLAGQWWGHRAGWSVMGT